MFSDWWNELPRFLHWGPVIVFSLMSCVTWTTLHVNAMWWPPGQSLGGALNFTLIVCLNLITVYHFGMSIVVGPGLLPKRWRPARREDEQFLQFCSECDGFKAPRAHHCRCCKRCVLRMDHHCPWINNCIGWANQANFILFLCFFMLGSIQSGLIIGFSFYEGVYRRAMLRQSDGVRVVLSIRSAMACLYSLGIVMGVFLATLKLMQLQLKAIIWNRSEIEDWIVQKAEFRRYANGSMGRRIRAFDYPYDMGVWRNIQETFNPSGDGIHWPVRPGCDQYTLTREQLAQKLAKRARTRTYRCIAPATGCWLPIFSQGLKVSICVPCSDDPRIVLHKGDLVMVTRIQAYWLYGERVLSEHEQTLRQQHQLQGHIRGWFPRRCAVELFDAAGDGGYGAKVKHQNPDQKKTKTGYETKRRKRGPNTSAHYGRVSGGATSDGH